VTIVRNERASFTVEQVELIVRDTLNIANENIVDESDRAILLPAIFEKVAQKEVTYEEVSPLGLNLQPRPQG